MSRTIERKDDRRSRRSRKMLADAFVELVGERGLDGFSITDLTELANVNRGTFYGHFSSKEDLLEYCESEFLNGISELEERIAQVPVTELGTEETDSFVHSVFVEIFTFVEEHEALLTALLGPKGDISFEHRIIDTVCTTLIDKILNEQYRVNRTPLVDYYVGYYSSAILGVVLMWLNNESRETPEEMATILVGIASLSLGDPIVL
ncbi:MAG: TetR/AcrR family transcriptional regulator [bacterium]|nr:TetR/AcrR family transcriptional regulator [bacterium]